MFNSLKVHVGEQAFRKCVNNYEICARKHVVCELGVFISFDCAVVVYKK